MLQRHFYAFCGVFLFSLLQIQAQNLNIVSRGKVTYPGQTMANICGYAAGGKEYALAGGSKGLAIIDVTKPDTLVKIVQLPGPDNLWKEIKTYKHYAYVTSEGGQGLQIVDLSKLPSPNLDYRFYTGDGSIADQLETIHALHVDTTKGFAYLYGSNLFSGGAIVLDLNTDPFNPTYVGKFDELGYIHDGWVDNDTLYAAHIFTGLFSIVDMTDKTAPKLLASQPTPNTFTHNTWMSVDRKTIFTTDEVDNSFLASYDITDPEDIKFLDKVQSNPGSNSMVHNTHILGNYAVTSWYNDGVTIVDASKPENLVQVGNFDMVPNTGGGSQGCWGVYPFLPSGNLLATVIETGAMWVLTPTYKRASYVEGKVTDATTGAPLSGVSIEISGTTPLISETTAVNGQYKLGQAEAGTIQVRAFKLGYEEKILTANISTGQVTILDFALNSVQTVAISGSVKDAQTGQPVANADVAVLGAADFYTKADANGNFNLAGIFPGTYKIAAGKWGYRYGVLNNQAVSAGQNYTVQIQKGYEDAFVFDYGWTHDGTSTQGVWERGEPIGVNPGILLSPDADVANDLGDQCYVTGNSTGEVAQDDVESGTMLLYSPVMDLTGYNNPIVKFNLFFTSVTINQESLDSLKVYIENGTEEKLLQSFGGFNFSWRNVFKSLKNEIPFTSTMRLRVECFDDPAILEFDSYEAAFDNFRVDEGSPVSSKEQALEAVLIATPNPFSGHFVLNYQSVADGDLKLQVTDLSGRITEERVLTGSANTLLLGEGWQPGAYFVRLLQENKVSKVLKVMKI